MKAVHAVEQRKSLSDYWRRDRSKELAHELQSVLQGAEMLIGNMGSGVHVTWSGREVSYTDLQRGIVALDYGPLRQHRCPFPGGAVDEVIGYAAHEGGHCLWSAPGRDESFQREIALLWQELPGALREAWQRDKRSVLRELGRVQNVLEDVYIDHRLASTWPVLGEYVRVARTAMAARVSVDLDTVARDPHPGRSAMINLWVSMCLYGHAVPGGSSDWVRRTLDGLQELTIVARDQESPLLRQALGVRAAALLWRPPKAGTEAERHACPPAPERPREERKSAGGPVTGADSGPNGEVAESGGDALGPTGAAEEIDANGEERPGGPQARQDDGGPGPADEEQSTPGFPRNLDDFDPPWGAGQNGRGVDQAPAQAIAAGKACLPAIPQDLSAAVAQTLHASPSGVETSVRTATYDPSLATRAIAQVEREVLELQQVFSTSRQPSRWTRGLTRGTLDEHRLWKPWAAETGFYKRRDPRMGQSLALGLLLDVSGSMAAHIPVLHQVAAVFAEGLGPVAGVDFGVWCYAGQPDGVKITRVAARSLPGLCLADLQQGGSTPSGRALAAAKTLLEGLSGRERLLIHFTDGRPENPSHVVRAVSACRMAAIAVYAIGLPEHRVMLERQYGEGYCTTIRAVSELPRALSGLLARVTTG